MNPSKKEHMSLAINDVSQEEKERNFILTKRYSRKLNQNRAVLYNKVVWERCFDNFSTIDKVNVTDLGWTFVTVTEVDKITESVNRVSAQV